MLRYNLDVAADLPPGMEVVATYLAIFFASLALSIAGMPIVRRIALTFGFVAMPAARKVHRMPTPLLGGVAIWCACLLALGIFSDRFNLPQLAAILAGATIVAVTGLVDDRIGMPPYLKLALQLVATAPLIFGGVRVESATPWLEINLVLTVLWVVGISNAMNLLDNMDGLAGGITAIASGFYLVLAAGSGQFLVASLAAAIAGATLGFLRFNFLAPARIFMGDAGSLFLGYVLAALAIKLQFSNIALITWIIPVVVLGIPLFDTTLVTISRLRRGLNPLTTPGKDHLSHRLVLIGLTQRESVLVIYMIAGMLGLTALFLRDAGLAEAVIVGVAILAVALYSIIRLERVYSERTTSPMAPVDVEPAGVAAK